MSATGTAFYCLGTKVPRRSAGIDRPTDQPWMKLKVHKCACVYVKRHHIRHAQHPQLIHTLPGLGKAIKQERLQQQELRLDQTRWVSEQLVSNNKVLSISSRACSLRIPGD